LGDVSYYILVFPMVALLLFLAKPLRPVMMFVFAIALYLLTALVLGFLLKLPDINVHWSEFPWIIPASLMWLFTATIFVGWALGRRRWYSILAYFVLTVPAGLSLNWWLPSSRIGLILLGFPSYALQVLFVWSLFKAFIHLQERISIPAQVLHSNLCWGFLTLLPSIFSSYAQQWWVTWTIALAYGIYVIVLHSNLRRLRAAHADRTGKRLLLLRVFGRADRREDLIDFLEDTWRHIGRIDLIAGTDLALRTLKTRMLEAFLLRRKDEQFLKSAEEVDRRLESLDSHLEGDARYPINSIYCYAAAWQQAVTRLAPQSDAVLMDLRGFTISNQGCVFELRFVIQYILLSRIVLLTDPTSDFQALAQVAELAWAQLPPESPNARLREPVLTILNSPRSRKECRLALFRLLLRASYPFDSRAGHDVGNGYARKREK